MPDSDEASRQRVAAIMLLREDNAILLQHRDNKPGLPQAGMWRPPGGHCGPDEPIEECMRRELREETGYDCVELNLLGSYMERNIEGVPAYPVTLFWACYDNSQPVRCLEGQAMEFIERKHAALYSIPEYLMAFWDLAIAASKQ